MRAPEVGLTSIAAFSTGGKQRKEGSKNPLSFPAGETEATLHPYKLQNREVFAPGSDPQSMARLPKGSNSREFRVARAVVFFRRSPADSSPPDYFND